MIKSIFFFTKAHERFFCIIKRETLANQRETFIFICKHLIHLHKRMFCAMFLFWPRSSAQYFKMLSMYFHYFTIISPRYRIWPFKWTNLNPFIQGCFVPSLVELTQINCFGEDFKRCQCIFAIISPWNQTWSFICQNLNPL